jgi:hypothetical protein
MGFDDRQSPISWTAIYSSKRSYIHFRGIIMGKHTIKTVHGDKYHTAIMDDGVWMLEVFSTEIALVQELKRLGFNIRNAKHVNTGDINGQLTHTWMWNI